MRASLVISLLLHGVVALLAIVGPLQLSPPPPPPPSMAIVVDFKQPPKKQMPPPTETVAPKGKPAPVKLPQPPEEKPAPVKSPQPPEEKPAPVKLPQPPEEKPAPVKLPQPPEEKPAPVKLPQPPEEKPAPVKSPQPPEKKPAPVKLPQPPEEKPEPVKLLQHVEVAVKPKTAPTPLPLQKPTAIAPEKKGDRSLPDAFASLLKHVGTIAKERAAASPPAPVFQAATLSEKDFIRKQIEDKWSFDPGTRGIGEMVITLRVRLAPDGRVRSVEIAGSDSYDSDPAYRSVAEAARRAVFLAQPLLFPTDKYQAFKDMTLTFHPGDLAR